MAKKWNVRNNKVVGIGGRNRDNIKGDDDIAIERLDELKLRDRRQLRGSVARDNKNKL